jgi:hypothetical protein
MAQTKKEIIKNVQSVQEEEKGTTYKWKLEATKRW